MSGGIWIGDVLRALRATDSADHGRVFQMLGFETPAVLARGDDSSPEPPFSPGVDGEPPDEPAGSAPQPAPNPQTRGSERPRPALSPPLLSPVRSPPVRGSASLGSPEQLGPRTSLPQVDQSRHLTPLLPHQPLLAAKTAPAILARMLSRPVPEGEIDIPALVDTMARCQPVTTLPRRPVPTLRYGVQLLVDLSPAMQPFRRDQEEVTRQIIATVGAEKVAVRYFAYCPLRGAGPRPGRTLPPYQLPARQTPILLLSDLGIGGPPGDFRRSIPAEWRQFGRTAAGNESAVTTLLVYPPERWPAWLPALGRAVTWDRTTTIASVPAGL